MAPHTARGAFCADQRGVKGAMQFVQTRSLRSCLYAAIALVSTALAWSAPAAQLERGAYLARITGCVGCQVISRRCSMRKRRNRRPLLLDLQ